MAAGPTSRSTVPGSPPSRPACSSATARCTAVDGHAQIACGRQQDLEVEAVVIIALGVELHRSAQHPLRRFPVESPAAHDDLYTIRPATSRAASIVAATSASVCARLGNMTS